MDPQQFQHELNRMNMQQQSQMVNQQMMNQQQQVIDVLRHACRNVNALNNPFG
jgi:hypothetical protein